MNYQQLHSGIHHNCTLIVEFCLSGIQDAPNYLLSRVVNHYGVTSFLFVIVN